MGETLLVADKKSLLAIDTGSGGLRWRFDAGGPLHAQPLLEVAGAVVFLQPFGEPKLTAVDLASGNRRWSADFEKAVRDKNRKIIVPEDTNLFKTTLLVKRDAEGRPEILFAADRKNLQAVRGTDGEVVWTAPVAGAQALLLAGEWLVAADKARVIHALGVSDGAQKWRYDAGRHVAQLARLGDALFATLYSKNLVVLGLRDLKVLGKVPLGDPYRLVQESGDRLIVCSQSGTVRLAPAPAD